MTTLAISGRRLERQLSPLSLWLDRCPLRGPPITKGAA
jgi:hypothetical protein